MHAEGDNLGPIRGEWGRQACLCSHLSPGEPAQASCTQEGPNEKHEKILLQLGFAQALASDEHADVRSCPEDSVLLDKCVTSLGPVSSSVKLLALPVLSSFCPKGSQGNLPRNLADSELHFQPESTSRSTGN